MVIQRRSVQRLTATVTLGSCLSTKTALVVVGAAVDEVVAAVVAGVAVVEGEGKSQIR